MQVPKYLLQSHPTAKRWAFDLAGLLLSDGPSSFESAPLVDIPSGGACMLYEGQDTLGHQPVRLYVVFDQICLHERDWRRNESKRDVVAEYALSHAWLTAAMLSDDGLRFIEHVPDGARRFLRAVDSHWSELNGLSFGATPFVYAVTSIAAQSTTIDAFLTRMGIAPSTPNPHRAADELRALVQRAIRGEG